MIVTTPMWRTLLESEKKKKKKNKQEMIIIFLGGGQLHFNFGGKLKRSLTKWRVWGKVFKS